MTSITIQPALDYGDDASGADIEFISGFIPTSKTETLKNDLLNELPWRCDSIVIYGRSVKQPRLSVWVADDGVDYRYSGMTMQPTPWTPSLQAVRRQVEQAANFRFNSVLLNLYRDGKDNVGWHRDNEPELGPQPVIASLSIGATRYFDLRHRDYRDNNIPVSRYTLCSGDLLIMRGKTQDDWQHRVPKQLRVSESRINLSFRQTGSRRLRKPHS